VAVLVYRGVRYGSTSQTKTLAAYSRCRDHGNLAGRHDRFELPGSEGGCALFKIDPIAFGLAGAKRVIQSQNSIVVQIIKSREISPIRMLGLRQFHDEVGRLSVINSRPSESTIGSSNGRLQAFFAIMFYGLLTAKDRPKAVFLSPSEL
jgi:hypothetical protein